MVDWGAPKSDNDGQRFELTTQNGVSYTYRVPGNTELGENNWYGFSLWEIPVDELKFDAKLDEDITVVADAQYTKYPFKVSVSLVKRSDGSLERLTYPDDVVIPTTANSKGLYIATVKLNDLLSGKDLTQYTSLAILLVRQRQSNDDYGNITIRQVYLHQNTSTNEITYDPVNGSHYVDLNSDAWSAWGCVSIKRENGKMEVTVAPKKDADGNYYKDDDGSPRVLGGLVLDIGQRDFTKVLRVQMNQEGGRVKGVYITGEGPQNNLTGKLLNYLDVVKQDGTDINGNQKFWYSQYDFRYIPYQHESESVRSMEWTTEWPYGNDRSTTHLPTNFTGQTMSISQFLITYDVFRAEPWHEASLRNAPLYSINNDKVSIDDGHFNYTTGLEVTGKKDASIEDWRVIYGSNLGLYNSRYAYVKGIDQIKIYATDGLTFEAVFDLKPDSWDNSKTVQSGNAVPVSESYKTTYQGKNDHNQYYVYTIDVPHDASRLHILKLIDGTGTVDNVTLYSATSPIDYYVSGQMWGSNANSSSTVTAALSNPLAMNIDATDLRNTQQPIALTSANKNCLVYVKNKDQVSNTDNVVVRSGSYPDYTYNADNIVLTDAVNSYMTDKSKDKDISSYHYPFFAPYDITAAQVTYTGYTGKYGTVCLPFSYEPNDVKVASGAQLSLYTPQETMSYDSSVGHYVVNATRVTGSLDANQPALIVNPDDTPVSYTVSANDVTVIKHTAASDLNITDPADNSKTDDTKEESELNQGNLQGVYSMRHPQVGGYVLQQQTGDKTVMFHKVVNNKPTLTQFRSYLVLPSTSKAKAQNVIGINFLDGETDATAIESATVHNDASKIVARYNAVGERVSAPVHGLNVVVMADGSVKKIIVK